MRNGIEVIDFRARPPSRPFLDYFNYKHVEFFAKRQVVGDLAKSYYDGSLDGFFAEADAAGVDRMVVINRMVPAVAGSPGCDIPNEHVRDLVAQRPDRLMGIAGIDVGGGFGDPLETTEHAVRQLGMRGIHISPGRSALDARPDDPRLFPLYELCRDLSVPVVFMTGPFSGPNIDYTRPAYIQTVASNFRELKVVAGHACWPYVEEMIGVAYRHENVFISPDSYLYMPGSTEMIRAVGDLLQDQFLYASSYPVGAMGVALDRFLALGYSDQVLEKTLSGNARRVLGI